MKKKKGKGESFLVRDRLQLSENIVTQSIRQMESVYS